jgi:hypothetical protein
MSRKELTLLRRGYRAGYHAAFRKCHADLHALAADFDSQIAALRNDFAEVVRDVHRFRAMERALDAGRDFNAWLN